MNFPMFSTSAGLLSASLFGMTFANWGAQPHPENAIVNDAHRAIRQVHPQTRDGRFDDSAADVRANVGLVCGLRLVQPDGSSHEYNYSADLGPGARSDRRGPWSENQKRCDDDLRG